MHSLLLLTSKQSCMGTAGCARGRGGVADTCEALKIGAFSFSGWKMKSVLKYEFRLHYYQTVRVTGFLQRKTVRRVRAIRSPPPNWSGARETAVEMERLLKAVSPPHTSPPTPLQPPAHTQKAAVRTPLSFLCFSAEVFGKTDPGVRQAGGPLCRSHSEEGSCLFRELKFHFFPPLK